MEECFLLEDWIDVGGITGAKSLFFSTLKKDNRLRLTCISELRGKSCSVLNVSLIISKNAKLTPYP